MASREMIERAATAIEELHLEMSGGATLGRDYAEQFAAAALDAALPQGEDVGGVVARLRLLVDDQIGEDLDYIRAADAAMTEAADLIQSQAAHIASLSAKVAEVEAERDERLSTVRIEAAEDQRDAAEARASELERKVERLRVAIRKAINILYHNLGRQDEKVRDVEPLLRAALQQEGEA